MTVMPYSPLRDRDIRQTGLFAEILEFCRRIRQPGTGTISDIADIDVHPDARTALFSGALMDRIEGTPATRICRLDLPSGRMQVLTFGPNADRSPQFAPDGTTAAFLSDRRRAGDFQLHRLDPVSGAVRASPQIEGRVEAFQWSPDSRSILLIVASAGSDSSSLEGAIPGDRGSETALPSWLPEVWETDDGASRRDLWLYDLERDAMRRIPAHGLNIWEAAWCGPGRIAAITSAEAGEDSWYSVELRTIDAATGRNLLLYKPADQLGCLSASRSGRLIAVVEAVASDRGSVAGNLLLVDAASGTVAQVDTAAVDVSSTAWRSESRIIVAGHRAAQSVVLEVDCASGKAREQWSDTKITGIGRYMSVLPLGRDGDAALFVAQGFERPPTVAEIRGGQFRPVLQAGADEISPTLADAEHITWQAPDGLDIEGWLLTPHGRGPFATVTWVHGGPTWHWRPYWLGATPALTAAVLLRHGYALFLPNPRGSTGRGQDFARMVKGDEGGADTFDILSGIDMLVARGTADPARLGVTGISYGGFMSAWLATQDCRFAAAVPVSPATDRISHLFTTNIPAYVTSYLIDRYDDPAGCFFTRSPIMHVRNARTPTLMICGALDRCTPPEQAQEFHNALLLSGVKSQLVTYPQEGHGVRSFPTAIDCAARSVAWFEIHMPSDPTRLPYA